jgi:hypothetical protein
LGEVLPLSDARKRVKRAREHLAKLDALLKAVPNPDDNRVLVDYKQELGCHVVGIYIAVLPDPESVPIATEAIHSLRCALDYVAWQLALLNRAGDEPSEQEASEIAFPICDEPRSFSGAQIIGHVGKEAAKELRLHQPYAKALGGAHDPSLLAPLRDLDNFGKHRLLMLRGANFGTMSLRYRFAEPIAGLRLETITQDKRQLSTQLPLTIPIFFLYAETEDGRTDVEVEIDPQPTVLPMFGSFGIDIGFDKLEAIAECVEFVVDRIDKRFFPILPPDIAAG